MRVILNGKPGWRYGVVLFVGVLLTSLALRYVMEGALQRDAIESVLLFASGFALLTTLLNRAVYGAQRPPDAPAPRVEQDSER